MSDHSSSSTPPVPPTLRVNRRQVLQASGVGLAGAGGLASALRVAGQGDGTPGASLPATPAAPEMGTPAPSPTSEPSPTPSPTPTPPAVPETSLRIVRSMTPEYYGEPEPGGDLSLYVRSADLLDFSPTAQRQDFQVLTSLYDPLVWIDDATMEPRPALAESWAWSDDGLSLTFTVRSSVAFHDGTPLSSEDVRFSLQAYRDDYESALPGFFALIADIAAPDPATVVVTFAEPDGAFLFNGASAPIFSSAQYAAYWERMPVGERSLTGFDWASNPPLGSGPWRYAEASDGGIVLARNDAYWQDAPHFERMRLIPQDDPQARIEGWRAGEVDLVTVGASDLDVLWNEEGTLFAAKAPVAMFAAFNFVNPANATADMMGDLTLRRALSLALDRDRYAREVFHDFIEERKAGTVSQPWAHEESILNPAQDIDEANRILDEAGWIDWNGDGMREHPTGNYLDLWCIVANTERPELLQILEMMKDDFAKIGASLTVQHIEPESFDIRWTQDRMYDMVAYSVLQYPAFAEYDLYGSAWDIRINPRGWNPGAYSNPVVDEALGQYFASWTQEDMAAALSTLQVAADEDLFGLWFGFPNDLILARPDIQGFQPHMYFQTANTGSLWRGVYVAPTPTPTPEPTATPEPTPAEVPATPVGTADREDATPVASPVN